MHYIVEFSDMYGTGLAHESVARVESDTPIPVPLVGDRIILNDRTEDGPAIEHVVRSRRFVYFTSKTEITQHVQLFCAEYQPQR